MKLRIMIRIDDAGMAAHVPGAVAFTEHKTFVVPVTPEVEAFFARKTGSYEQRQIIGVEILSEPT